MGRVCIFGPHKGDFASEPTGYAALGAGGLTSSGTSGSTVTTNMDLNSTGSRLAESEPGCRFLTIYREVDLPFPSRSTETEKLSSSLLQRSVTF